MKRVTYLDKTLLVGDDTADTLLRYATLLATKRTPDSVTIHATGGDGQAVEASYLLGDAVPFMVASTHFSMPERDNSEVVAYMKRRLAELEPARPVPANDEPVALETFDEFDLDS